MIVFVVRLLEDRDHSLSDSLLLFRSVVAQLFLNIVDGDFVTFANDFLDLAEP